MPKFQSRAILTIRSTRSIFRCVSLDGTFEAGTDASVYPMQGRGHGVLHQSFGPRGRLRILPGPLHAASGHIKTQGGLEQGASALDPRCRKGRHDRISACHVPTVRSFDRRSPGEPQINAQQRRVLETESFSDAEWMVVFRLLSFWRFDRGRQAVLDRLAKQADPIMRVQQELDETKIILVRIPALSGANC